MLELILSALFLISPQDSTNVPFDITIVFDPPEDPKYINVYLDDVEIKGEKEQDYFYRIIKNLSPGEHLIKVHINKKRKEWKFIVIQRKEKIPMETWGNLSLGIQNSYSSDSLYSGESGPVYGVDLTFGEGTHSINLSLLHDPDYPSRWYPFFSYYGNKVQIEGGYIYPFFDEITIYSSGGFGITGNIDIGFLTLSPIFLYSKNYDTLFPEYPRLFYGGKLELSNNNVNIGVTLFQAKDDTSNLTGFPLTSPKQSIVFSPEFRWQISDEFSLKLKGGYSKGKDNLFVDTVKSGNIFEGSIIYEHDYNDITIGLRKTSLDYLTLGNPYLYTNRTSAFLTGIYERGLLYTDFDHLIYKKEGVIGFSFLQTFKFNLNNYFSPLFECQWVKYREYGSDEYQYMAGGFESIFGDVQVYNIFGTYRNSSSTTNSSFQLSSFLHWYPAGHSIGFGVSASFDQGYVRFDVDLSMYFKLWDLGYIDIYYYPSIKEGYDHHSLRIIYEYEF